jgi:hypothetical protein
VFTNLLTGGVLYGERRLEYSNSCMIGCIFRFSLYVYVLPMHSSMKNLIVNIMFPNCGKD